MDKPTKEEIKEARNKAGLTQQQASETLYRPRITWVQWEKGVRTMPQDSFEFFLLKTGQHPVYHLTKRRKKENEHENKS